MSKRIQLNTIDLGGGTTKGCDCDAPNLSDYAKKEDVPKKVSELENDEDFVKSNSLGSAAFKNVEDLQGGGNTCLQQRYNINGDITYDYLSPFYNKKVRLWQAGMTVLGNYSISFEFGEAGSEAVAQGEINNGSAIRFVVTQERIAGSVKIELTNYSSGEIVYTGYVSDGLTGIYISSSPKYNQIYY